MKFIPVVSLEAMIPDTNHFWNHEKHYKKEYFGSFWQRYSSRNFVGRSAMINEVIDVFGWDS
jgi:hypothetical protein